MSGAALPARSAAHPGGPVTESFSASGFRDSLRGGTRFICYWVEHRPRWWSRRPWAVLLDYSGGNIHDQGALMGWFRTLEEANAHAARLWQQVEADHAEAVAYRERRRKEAAEFERRTEPK